MDLASSAGAQYPNSCRVSTVCILLDECVARANASLRITDSIQSFHDASLRIFRKETAGVRERKSKRVECTASVTQ